jgi:hypothetical protein
VGPGPGDHRPAWRSLNPADLGAPFDRATPQEMRALDAYCHGGSYGEAAFLLGKSLQTVKHQLGCIYRILRLRGGPHACRELGRALDRAGIED